MLHGFTIGVCGGFELEGGLAYGARRARFETTCDEAKFRSRAWHPDLLARDGVLLQADGRRGHREGDLMGWHDGRRRLECSIGGAILALVCGVGQCHDLCRLYNVDAFEWYPPALVNELYMESHAIELDYSRELQKLFWAFLDIELEYSGAALK